jgi:hypothetical protein
MKRDLRITGGTAYTAGNLESARVILQDIMRYGGEEAGLVQWARRMKGEPTPTPGDATAGTGNARRACQTIPGGETCCMCGLVCYPAHRPELAEDVFCAACCPVCRPAPPMEE